MSSPRNLLVFLCLMYLLIGIDSAHAQVLNVEQYAVDADTADVWMGSLSFGFNLSKQRRQVINLRNDANLTYFSTNHQYLFLNRINLLDVAQEVSVNDGYFHLRGIFNRHRRFNPEGFIQYQYNFETGMQRRFLTGSTIRINLISESSFSGSIGTGLMLENELWTDEEGEEEVERTLLKSTSSVNIRESLGEHIELVFFGYYQARPDRFFEPRITMDGQVQFRIMENMRLSIQWVSTYDAAPVLDSPQWVYSLTNNIIFSF